MVLCTTSLDVKVQRRMAAVPFGTITSGSAWISMADAVCDTAKKTECDDYEHCQKHSWGLDMRLGHTDAFEPQLVKTLCS